jgi:hypothetical protein
MGQHARRLFQGEEPGGMMFEDNNAGAKREGF